MPDDVAMDKVLVLEKLGAKVERVRPGQSIPEYMDTSSMLTTQRVLSMRNR
jgi:hypothetical protein